MPHLHECKDREDDICDRRGYCECECGARAVFTLKMLAGFEEASRVWKAPLDLMAALNVVRS